MIKKRALIWIVIIWIIITLINYYYTNFFILAFIWLGLSAILFVGTIVQIVKLIKELKNLTKFRIAKLIVFGLLFVLTFFRHIPNELIEKVDWIVLKGKRTEIVEKIKSGELIPNGTSNKGICELPFEFPIVSNGGNDVWIIRNKENSKLTVRFFVFRNFFDSPSTKFVFTEDEKTIETFEKRIKEKPKNNWKLDENWYRIYGDVY
ncbi:MAG: hypothetical protein P8P29_05025 [Flavobacteriaceae bacterium]|nr:hypothetical protein [Flavobacteriaceae bacterium]